MRIACLQFNPSLGKFPQNVERAEALLEGAQPGAWDLLMLPELAFTGL
jgi:protein N-terminal amidase